MMQTFDISPRKVARLLLYIAIGLSLASFAASLTQNFLGTTLGGMTTRLLVGNDSSLPTWFASFLLFIGALLLGFIAFIKKKQKGSYIKHWIFLCLLFLYISIDEVATFRETAFSVVKRMVSVDGFFYYVWVIAAIPFVIIMALAYLKFFAHLPQRVRTLFTTGCILYVLGAIGLEMTAAAIHSAQGTSNPMYHMVTTFEEFLEMAGVIIVIYSLLLYIRFENIRSIQVRIELPQKERAAIKAGSDRY